MPIPTLEELKARLAHAEKREAEALAQANAAAGAAAILRGLIAEWDAPAPDKES